MPMDSAPISLSLSLPKQDGALSSKPVKEPPQKLEIFGNYTRFVILLISTICLTLIISNGLSFNFSVICMTKEGYRPIFINGTRQAPEDVDMRFTKIEENNIISILAVGTIIGSLPITYLTSTLGIRRMFAAYGFFSAICVTLTPFVISLGLFPLMVLRVLQGFGSATSFVAMAAISASWSPLSSTGLYISWISCHLQFAPMLNTPMGILCDSSWGWPSIFYLQGIISAVAFTIFFLIYRDKPSVQRNVSHKELCKIEFGKNNTNLTRKERRVPYKAMFVDPVVWGILLSAFGGMLGFNVFSLYGPKFLNKALKLDVKKTGILSSMPYVLACLMKLIAGPLSDRITFMKERSKVIFFASTSQFVMAICFVVLGSLPAGFPTLSLCAYTAAIVFSGLNCVGVVKCTQLIAQHFSHAIMAWNTLTSSFGVLLMPVVMRGVLPNETLEEWGRLFTGTAILLVMATLIFNFTADVNPRYWTNQKISATSVCSVLPDDSVPQSPVKIYAVDLDPKGGDIKL